MTIRFAPPIAALVLLMLSCSARAQHQDLYMIETPRDNYITMDDSLNKTLLIRKGLDVSIINGRIVSPKKGKELVNGYDVYYLYIVKAKEVRVNGEPIANPIQKKYEEVPIVRKKPQERKPRFQEMNFNPDMVREESSNSKTQESDSAQAEKNKQQDDKDCFLSGLFGGKKEQPAAEADTAAADSLAAGEEGGEAEEKPSLSDSTLQPAEGRHMVKGPGGITIDTTKKRFVKDDFGDYQFKKRLKSEEELYLFLPIVSKHEKLSSLPDSFQSRALFLRGVVDKRDSVDVLFDLAAQYRYLVDSVGMAIDTMANVPQRHIETFDSLNARYKRYRTKFWLYRDMKQAGKSFLGIFNRDGWFDFFLSDHFYARGLHYNIRSAPYGLPEYTVEEVEPEAEEEPPPDQAAEQASQAEQEASQAEDEPAGE